MKFFEENKELVTDIIDLTNSNLVEYAHIFCGTRADELKAELLKIKESLDKVSEIMKDNYEM